LRTIRVDAAESHFLQPRGIADDEGCPAVPDVEAPDGAVNEGDSGRSLVHRVFLHGGRRALEAAGVEEGDQRLHGALLTRALCSECPSNALGVQTVLNQRNHALDGRFESGETALKTRLLKGEQERTVFFHEEIESDGCHVVAVHEFRKSWGELVALNQAREGDDGESGIRVGSASDDEPGVLTARSEVVTAGSNGDTRPMALCPVMVHGQGAEDRAVTAESAFDGFPSGGGQGLGLRVGMGEVQLKMGWGRNQSASPLLPSPGGILGGSV